MTKHNHFFARFFAILTFLFFMSFYANATDGYFSNGIGVQLKSMAGAGVATAISPLHAATNPASLALLNSGYDINLSVFIPKRDFEVTGAPSGFPGTFGLAPGKVESSTNSSSTFFIPALAANWKIGENKAFGLAIYGNGGMNTDYDAPVFGFTPTGVNLIQMFVQPTFAFKIGEKFALGVSPILGYQRFRAEGLAAFGQFSSDPTAISDNGNSSSIGFGAKVGIQGELHEMVSIGAAFQTKMKMGEFEEYAGLFAEGGGFDIPMNWTAGATFNLMLMEVSFDVKRIYYSEVKSIGNPILPNLGESLLGSENAAGFGWDDITVFKVGVNYPVNEEWNIRAGFSFGDQPVQASEVMFNILAPGVIEKHITFGFSRMINYENELSFFVSRSLSNNVEGPNPLEAPGQQTIDLRMDQWEFGVGYTF